MVLSQTVRNRILTIGGIAVVVVAYFWIYPLVSSLIPRTFDVRSRTNHVVGEYYPLTLDGVENIYIQDGNLVVNGFDMRGFTATNQHSVSRALPKEFSQIVVPDSSWKLVPNVSGFAGVTYRIFVRPETQDTVQVGLPALNDQPTWAAYRGVGDTTLFVLASGNWKRDEKVFLGYVAIWKKRST